GNSSDFWRSTNGGASWTNLNSLPVGSWSHLDFLDDSNGFAGSNGALAFTSNAGNTWTLRSAYPDCPVIYGMSFRDGTTGLASGELISTSEAGVFKTTNGGISWTRTLTQGSNDVIWLTSSTALATSGTTIYRSTNAGDSWIATGASISTGLLDLALASPSIVVGVSSKGDVWRSTDAGLSWQMTSVGIGALPDVWRASFSDAQNGWVVGPGGFALQSTNGGANWTMRNRGTNFQIFDVEMLNEQYGLAVGWAGYVLRTTNGGDFWETKKLEVTGQVFGRDEHLYAVSIVDAEFAVAAGPGGTVFRTYDAGDTWESIGYPELPGTYWIEDVKFTDRFNGWLVGLDQDFGHGKSIYRTTDGGSTWTQPLSQNSFLWAVDFIDGNHGWIASIGPLYLRTTNGGANWTSGALPNAGFTPTISDMKFANASVGWTVGWDGYVAKSTNGGVSWQLQSFGAPNPNLHALGMDVVSASEVWVTGRDPVNNDQCFVAHTTNGGTSWTREFVQDHPYIMSEIETGPSGSIWVGGYAGRVLKQEGTAVDVALPAPATRPLLHAARPNPTSSSAAISFEIPSSGRAILEVYDVNGRQAARLWEGLAEAGLHEVQWGEEAAPGIYFVKLEYVSPLGERVTESQKVVRIR
ncbi:MAG TPA: YCF48-related protein, partial [bacterium]|nr:YCF48-related protein [bacterium]